MLRSSQYLGISCSIWPHLSSMFTLFRQTSTSTMGHINFPPNFFCTISPGVISDNNPHRKLKLKTATLEEEKDELFWKVAVKRFVWYPSSLEYETLSSPWVGLSSAGGWRKLPSKCLGLSIISVKSAPLAELYTFTAYKFKFTFIILLMITPVVLDIKICICFISGRGKDRSKRKDQTNIHPKLVS